MLRTLSQLSLFSVLATMVFACTPGGELAIGTTVRAAIEPPDCNLGCPEHCLVNINEAESGPGFEATWHIFDANELHHTALRKSVVQLNIPSDVWSRSTNEFVPETVPSILSFQLDVPETFDIYDVEMEAKLVLGSPTNAVLVCGFSVP